MKTKTAQRESQCPWCQQTISAGEEVFPVLESLCHYARSLSTNLPQPTTTTTAASRQCLWIHANCAVTIFTDLLNKPIEPPACRHWLRLRNCPFGSDCFFLHPIDPTPHLAVKPEKRTWGGKRKKLFKPTSSIFRAWLLQTFGQEYLQQNNNNNNNSTGVLEIAGGKGELAFELQNLSGIPTHVVDPRALTLRSAYLKWKSGHYDKAAQNPVLNKFLTHYNPHQLPLYPGHLRVFFNDKLIQTVVQYQQQQQQQEQSMERSNQQQQDDWWKECREYAQRQTWTRKGLELVLDNATDEPKPITTVTDDDPWLSNAPKDITDATQALSILSNCSAVLGMHPDQATEATVDFALATNKPFAVVPCCVFSSQFPNRHLQDGTPVRSTPQLVQYLKEKDQRIQVETLGFEGMNQVVFLTPEDCS